MHIRLNKTAIVVIRTATIMAKSVKYNTHDIGIKNDFQTTQEIVAVLAMITLPLIFSVTFAGTESML